MISIISQEHNEDPSFVHKMVEQASKLKDVKEFIYVTSSSYKDFHDKFGDFEIPVSIIPNVQSCGAARNEGGKFASGDKLLYMDSHVCFKPEAVDRLMQTLDTHQNAIVAPSLIPIGFPSCAIEGNTAGYGVEFRFTEGNPFEWVWNQAVQYDQEFQVPFVCGCAFAMKKDTFNVLQSLGGFLSDHTGLSWEEEKSMRLWRFGHPTYSEPRAQFGHLFKGHPGKPQWDEHSTSGYYRGRVIGAYINIFNEALWNKIDGICTRAWGNNWTSNLKYARDNYGWLRAKIAKKANAINENWFLKT